MDNWNDILQILTAFGVVINFVVVLYFGTKKFTNLERDVEENTKGVAENKQNISRIDDKLNQLAEGFAEMKGQLSQIISQMAQVVREMTQMRGEINRMNGEIHEIKGHLGLGQPGRGQLPEMPQEDLAASSSPMTLTKKGQTISKGVNAPDLAKKYAKKAKVPKSADNLQIQDMSLDYAASRLIDEVSAEDRKKIRNYSFDSGHPIPHVLTVIGYEMRDVILGELNPEALEAMKKKAASRKAKGRAAVKKKAAKAA